MESSTAKIDEEWKDVVGWEGSYQVSDTGRVRSLDRSITRVDGVVLRVRGQILKQATHKNTGYRLVSLARNCNITHAYVHRLVLEAFVGPCPPGMETCHGTGEGRGDNRLTNLSWGTHAQNAGPDRVRDGTMLSGERSPAAKFTWDEVRSIRADPRSGRELARVYGVQRVTIYDIRNFRSWRDDPCSSTT